jgi:hypothetical protein
LTAEERASFRAYAEANRTEPDGTESQWASYTLRLLDDLTEALTSLAQANDTIAMMAEMDHEYQIEAEGTLAAVKEVLLAGQAAGHDRRYIGPTSEARGCYSTCLACFAGRALRAAEGV